MALSAILALGATLAAGSSHPSSRRQLSYASGGRSAAPSGPIAPAPVPAPPALVVGAPPSPGAAWQTVAVVHGHPAAWIARRGPVTLLRFDQRALRLDLHAGSSDGGTAGWRYGDEISASEIHHIVAAFNGGFKLTYRDVGFLSGGHVAVPLSAGLASIVTYTDGTTDVGAWDSGLHDPARKVYSVLQNQRLLVDHGEIATDASSCIIECWGETIKQLTSVARSALGIRADGELVWAAGESLVPQELAEALVHAGVVRAAELDINPDWVAGYLYVHHPGGPVASPVLPGQIAIAGKLLEPYSRDFLTIVDR